MNFQIPIKRLALVLLAILALSLLAACSGQASADEQARLEKLDQISQQIASVQQTLADTQAKQGELETKMLGLTHMIESFNQQDIMRQGGSRAVYLPDAPSGQVTVRAEFVFVGDKELPTKFRSFEPAGEANSLWAMQGLGPDEPLPVGAEIPDNTYFLEPGVGKLVTLVLENPTDKDIQFLVTAPAFDPFIAHNFGAFTCLCASVPFTIPAGGKWYRTIRAAVNPQSPPGFKVIAIFPVTVLS